MKNITAVLLLLAAVVAPAAKADVMDNLQRQAAEQIGRSISGLKMSQAAQRPVAEPYAVRAALDSSLWSKDKQYEAIHEAICADNSGRQARLIGEPMALPTMTSGEIPVLRICSPSGEATVDGRSYELMFAYASSLFSVKPDSEAVEALSKKCAAKGSGAKIVGRTFGDMSETGGSDYAAGVCRF